jgi:hypothetical protein
MIRERWRPFENALPTLGRGDALTSQFGKVHASHGQLLARVTGMHDGKRDALIPLALLSAASGARTFAGVAAISGRSPARFAAAGELIYDKVPSVPSRLDSSSLLGRIAAGALVGALVAGRTGTSRRELAVLGGLIAFASATATYRLRHTLSERLPALAAGLVEDALVVSAAAGGAALLRRTSPRRAKRTRRRKHRV